MRAGVVHTCDEQPHTVRTLSIVLRVDLGFICDGVYDTSNGNRTLVEETGCHGLLAHKVGENTGIWGETGESYAQMLVNWDDLLLVGAQLFSVSL